MISVNLDLPVDDIIKLTGAAVTLISAITAAIVSVRSSRKIDAVKIQTDGMMAELKRQNVALKLEVARVHGSEEATTPEQLAGKGGAPVGISRGVVSVENTSPPRRIDDPKDPKQEE